MKQLVSTNWLYKNLFKKNLVILDCSYYLPNENGNTKKEYLQKHIKNSFFFDIDKISNNKNTLPHMIPDHKKFEKEVNKFGIISNSTIVAYDSKGIFSSPRVWWMFKYFGHKKIYVLDGGLKKWINEKKPISQKKTISKKGNFESKICKEWLINSQDILKSIKVKSFLVLDARSKDRFNGLIEEPRKNLKSGHIPGSRNIFWKNLITNKGQLISKTKIINIFKKYNIKNKKIITSCGSGISACILSFSLLHAFNIKSSVYDGSWSEWGSKKGLPIEK